MDAGNGNNNTKRMKVKPVPFIFKSHMNINYTPGFFFFFPFFFFFKCLHLQLEVKSELQLPAYTTDTAISDPSHSFILQCSLQQHRILLNPLSKATDQTHILTGTALGS